MPVSHCDEVAAVFGKRQRLHFGANFVAGHLRATTPVPHVHDHVVLGSYAYNVLVSSAKCLKKPTPFKDAKTREKSIRIFCWKKKHGTLVRLAAYTAA